MQRWCVKLVICFATWNTYAGKKLASCSSRLLSWLALQPALEIKATYLYLNQACKPFERCVPTTSLTCAARELGTKYRSVPLWSFCWKSISHLLFWHPITLGLQPLRPITSKVESLVEKLNFHSYSFMECRVNFRSQTVVYEAETDYSLSKLSSSVALFVSLATEIKPGLLCIWIWKLKIYCNNCITCMYAYTCRV